MIYFIFLIEIVNLFIVNPWIFFWIAAYIADVTAVNPNYIKAFLSNSAITFFIKVIPTLINGPKTLSKLFPFWFMIFLVVSFNKTYLFSEDLINFKKCYCKYLITLSFLYTISNIVLDVILGDSWRRSSKVPKALVIA